MKNAAYNRRDRCVWHTMLMMARPGMMKLPMKGELAGVSDDDKKNVHFIINKL